ncbi:MAG: T9SS type A sorting domain-containing protein, partial [Flavobacteriales bacterium]|nr:T9SS type A sorting domain-containing protein [Flavobacteriales bacterium]
YVKVFNYYGGVKSSYSSFDICVWGIPKPPNNDCSNAINLIAGTSCTYTSGTLLGSNQSTSPCIGTGGDMDVWYKFVATTDSLTIKVNPNSNLNIAFEILDGSCSGSSLLCENDWSTGSTESYTNNNFIIGNTYYVKVFNYYGGVKSSYGSFDICVYGNVSHSTSQPKIFGKESSVKIYPNPTSSIVNIEFPYTAKTYQIIDLTGRVISQDKTSGAIQKVDLSNYQNGTYLFKILGTNNETIAMKKIIKQ